MVTQDGADPPRNVGQIGNLPPLIYSDAMWPKPRFVLLQNHGFSSPG